jgi:hypothetical protein
VRIDLIKKANEMIPKLTDMLEYPEENKKFPVIIEHGVFDIIEHRDGIWYYEYSIGTKGVEPFGRVVLCDKGKTLRIEIGRDRKHDTEI